MDTPQAAEAPANTSTVFTGAQSMAQFYAEPPADVVVRLNEGIVAADSVSGAEGQDTVAGGDAEPEEIKDNPKLKDRFSELTAKRKAAEKAAQEAADAREAERTARQQAEIERDALRAKYEPPKTTLSPKPVADNFVSTDDFAKAMESWAMEAAEFKVAQNQRVESEKAHRDAVEKSFKASIEAAKTAIPDFDDVVTKSTVLLSDEAMTAIREDDNAGVIVYHLAQNPEIAEKLTKMSVPAMNREIGRLSAKLERPAQQAAPATPLASISKAPAPISPSRGVAAGSGSYDTSKMTFQQYSALRDSGKLGKR